MNDLFIVVSPLNPDPMYKQVTDQIKEAIALGLTTVNEVKRYTRAGMGLCQGKTCGQLVMRILAQETGQNLAQNKGQQQR